MELHNLTPAEGSNKNKKVRIGRGQGSGKGGTAARGHKGAKSRSGYSRKSGFEGGQMPLQRRIPKFGFKNINRIEHLGINLDVLQTIADNDKSVTTIDLAYLVENGYAHNYKAWYENFLKLGYEIEPIFYDSHSKEELQLTIIEKANYIKPDMIFDVRKSIKGVTDHTEYKDDGFYNVEKIVVESSNIGIAQIALKIGKNNQKEFS